MRTRIVKWSAALAVAAACVAVALGPERLLRTALDVRFQCSGVSLHRGSDAGRSVSWYEGGEGPAILLLHGAGADAASSWYSLLPSLSGRWRVLAPELGFADPPSIKAADVVGLEINRVRSVLRLAGVRRVVVVGLSAGGWLGLRLAAEDPGLVDAVVAVAPAGPNLDGLLRRVAEAGGDPGDWFARRLFHDPPPLAEYFLRSRSALVRAWMGSLAHHLERMRTAGGGPDLLLRRVGCPVTLVWGRDDAVLPASDADYYAARLDSSRVEVLERCGHAVVWDRPGALARIVEHVAEGTRS